MAAHAGHGTGLSPTTLNVSSEYFVVGETLVVSLSGGFSRRALRNHAVQPQTAQGAVEGFDSEIDVVGGMGDAE
jgi:hypothetical protein